MEVSLAGRNALITGASKGLGLAMSKRFSASGANVLMVARRPADLAEALAAAQAGAKGKVISLSADVSTAEGCEAAFNAAVAEFGQLDILVNNAGSGAARPFQSITDADWQHDLDLKLFAAIRFMRLALPGMRERRWGRIINVLSRAARTPGAKSGPSSVTRAAGLALMKAVASEVAPDNVLVNAMLPGLYATEQTSRHKAPDITLDEHFARIGQGTPLGRVGNPEEFANLACFLASDLASYITGAGINADGGAAPAP